MKFNGLKLRFIFLFTGFAQRLSDGCVGVLVCDEFADDRFILLEELVDILVVLRVGDVDRADEVDVDVALDSVGRSIFPRISNHGGFHFYWRSVAPNEANDRRFCIVVIFYSAGAFNRFGIMCFKRVRL